MFVVVFLTLFISAIVYTFGMQPVYEASSTLQVKPEKGNALGFGMNDMYYAWGDNLVEGEIQIIMSQTIAEKVAERLHLDWSIEKSDDKSVCKVIDIEAQPNIKKLILTMTGESAYLVSDEHGRKLGEGSSGVPMAYGQLLLTVQVKGRKGDTFTLARIPLEDAAGGAMGCSVSQVGKMTNVIQVSWQDTDPERARDIVNAIVQAYVDQSLEFKSQEAGKTVDFIEEQLANVRNELTRAESNLQEYKSTAGVVQLDSEASELIRTLSALEQQLVSIELSRKQLDFALASQRESLAKGKPYSPAVLREDPLVSSMAGKLADLEVQKRSLMLEYTANHPAVQNIQTQIDEIQEKIRSTYQTGLNNLTRQESDVRHRLALYEDELRVIPVEERDLARYTRLAKVSGDIYTYLLQKHEEARIAKASTISNINVIDKARTPKSPVRPQKRKYLMIGFMVSTIVAFSVVLLIDFLDDSVKTEHQAKKALGLNHLATIPFIGSGAEKGRDDKNKKDKGKESLLISHTDQRSIVAEAFRALRTSLHFSALGRHRKITVLTSAFSGEGKSTIASNLAIILAQTGAKTLLIDGDLHKSTLHDKFGLKKVPGITEVLAGDADLGKAMQVTGIDNLTFLSTGTIPPNPSVILGSEDMKALLDRLRDSYDQIVIDAPPTIPVADAVVLTSFADSVLVVMEAGRIPLKAAVRLGEMLHTAKAPLAGFVFNNRTLRGSRYGYGYGYGYGHGYGYGYGQEHKEPKHGRVPRFVRSVMSKFRNINRRRS